MEGSKSMEVGASPRFLAFMVGLGVFAVLGQFLSLRALASFHDEKALWEARAQQRQELLEELGRLSAASLAARASADQAIAVKDEAQKDLADVQAELESERLAVLQAREAYSEVTTSARKLTAEAEGLRSRIGVLEKQRRDLGEGIAKLELKQAELSASRDNLVELQVQVGDLEARQERVLAELGKVQLSLLDKNEELATLQGQLVEARSTIAEAAQSRVEFTSTSVELTQARQDLQVAIGSKNEALKAAERAEEALERIEAETSAARARWEAENSSLSVQSKDLGAVQAEMGVLGPRRDELKREVQILEAKQAQLQGDVADLEAAVSTQALVKRDLVMLRSEKTALLAELPDLRSELADLGASVAAEKAEAAALSRQITDLQTRKSSLDRTVAAIQPEASRLDALRAEVEGLQAIRDLAEQQIIDLEKKRSALGAEVDSLRGEARAFQSDLFEQLSRLADAVGRAVGEKETEDKGQENKDGE